jgi:hypothetical protein
VFHKFFPEILLKFIVGDFNCKIIDIHIFRHVRYRYSFTLLERPLGLQEVEAPRSSRWLAHKGGNVVSRMHRLPFHRRRYKWFLFLLEAELTPAP